MNLRRLNILIVGVAFMGLSGCETMQKVSEGVYVAGQVASIPDYEYTGTVTTMSTHEGVATLKFSEGATYQVKQWDPNVDSGVRVDIFRIKGGFRAVKTDRPVSDVVYRGKVKRVDYKASKTIVTVEDNKSFEVEGSPALSEGSLVEIVRSSQSYTARIVPEWQK